MMPQPDRWRWHAARFADRWRHLAAEARRQGLDDDSIALLIGAAADDANYPGSEPHRRPVQPIPAADPWLP